MSQAPFLTVTLDGPYLEEYWAMKWRFVTCYESITHKALCLGANTILGISHSAARLILILAYQGAELRLGYVNTLKSGWVISQGAGIQGHPCLIRARAQSTPLLNFTFILIS